MIEKVTVPLAGLAALAGLIAQELDDVPGYIDPAVRWGSPAALLFAGVQLVRYIYRSAAQTGSEAAREANERADEWARSVAEQARAEAAAVRAYHERRVEIWRSERDTLVAQIAELQMQIAAMERRDRE